ncbi:putative leucine-rich repeat-containing protein DDB_G0290503 [Procambarus clarkii]|uniref:putative leucine-rich repeat-containing protein DDB_G0290503 n=1 Tax=Procambarus clarkii TaxID=6728 RepID=UPI003742467B
MILLEYIGRCLSKYKKQKKNYTSFTDFFAKTLVDEKLKEEWVKNYIATSENLTLKDFYTLEEVEKTARKHFRDEDMQNIKEKLIEQIPIAVDMKKVEKLRDVFLAGDISWFSLRIFAKEVGLKEEVIDNMFNKPKVFIYTAHALQYRDSRERQTSNVSDNVQALVTQRVHQENCLNIYKEFENIIVQHKKDLWLQEYLSTHREIVLPMTRPQILIEASGRGVQVTNDTFEEVYKKYRPDVGLLSNASQCRDCPFYLIPNQSELQGVTLQNHINAVRAKSHNKRKKFDMDKLWISCTHAKPLLALNLISMWKSRKKNKKQEEEQEDSLIRFPIMSPETKTKNMINKIEIENNKYEEELKTQVLYLGQLNKCEDKIEEKDKQIKELDNRNIEKDKQLTEKDKQITELEHNYYIRQEHTNRIAKLNEIINSSNYNDDLQPENIANILFTNEEERRLFNHILNSFKTNITDEIVKKHKKELMPYVDLNGVLNHSFESDRFIDKLKGLVLNKAIKRKKKKKEKALRKLDSSKIKWPWSSDGDDDTKSGEEWEKQENVEERVFGQETTTGTENIIMSFLFATTQLRNFPKRDVEVTDTKWKIEVVQTIQKEKKMRNACIAEP